MTQYKEKGHFVRNMLSCSWCNGYVILYGCYANGLRFGSRLADFHFVFLCFFQAPLRCYLYGLMLLG